jgi:hypothetical protein
LVRAVVEGKEALDRLQLDSRSLGVCSTLRW